MAGSLPASPFGSPAPLEKRMCSELAELRLEGIRRILVVPANGAEWALTAHFLRWFLLEAMPALELPLVQLELRDVTIVGKLDLAGTKSKILPRFVNCDFQHKIDLSDAEMAGFEMLACRVREIFADRFTTKGSFRVCAPSRDDDYPRPAQVNHLSIVTGEIRLCGAKISGNLDLRGGWFRGVTADDAPAIPIFADGAHIEGNALLSEGFHANGEVRLNGCTFERNLDCSGATLANLQGYNLSAAGAHIVGSVYLGKRRGLPRDAAPIPFQSIGSFRLEGAKIDGDLDCEDSQFTAAGFAVEGWPPVPAPDAAPDQAFFAVEASGMEVGGDVIFSGAFHARGIVDLIAAKIEGDFNCEDAFFDFPGEEPLRADGIVVAGTTFLDRSSADNPRATTNGILRFPQASFQQGLFVDHVVFDVSGICRNRLHGSTTAGELKHKDQGVCGIFAPLAEVNGKFRWRKIKKKCHPDGPHNPLWLHLAAAKADAVDDQEEAWRRLDRFDVTGCEYRRILDLTADVGWRTDELDRQYATLSPQPGLATLSGYGSRLVAHAQQACLAWRALCRAYRRWGTGQVPEDADAAAVERFSPLPYLQLAKTLRDEGYEKAANDVLVTLERNRTRYSDFGVLRQLGRWVLGLVLCYGFAPFRPLLYLFAMIVFSACVFDAAYDRGLIVATSDNATTCDPPGPSKAAAAKSGNVKLPAPTACEATRPVQFSAVVFAIDNLVPLVDINQKKNWVVRTKAPPAADDGAAETAQDCASVCAWLVEWEGFPNLLYIFNIFLGWLLTTLFAAGFTGLVRGGKDSD